jgi:hypothetical protein
MSSLEGFIKAACSASVFVSGRTSAWITFRNSE